MERCLAAIFAADVVGYSRLMDEGRTLARLEGLAEPGGICISGKVYEEVGDKLPTTFGDVGEQKVKNIPEPIRGYRWAASCTWHKAMKMQSRLSTGSCAQLQPTCGDRSLLCATWIG